METSGLKHEFEHGPIPNGEIYNEAMMKFFYTQDDYQECPTAHIESIVWSDLNYQCASSPSIINTHQFSPSSSSYLEINENEDNKLADSLEILSDDEDNEIPKTICYRNLFKIKPSLKKKDGYFKANGNVLVMHAFNPQNPDRVTFESVEPIYSGEIVRVFLINLYDRTQHLKATSLSSMNNCLCIDETHNSSLFCVKVEGGQVDWSLDRHPTATITVPAASEIEIKFGALMSTKHLRSSVRSSRLLSIIVFELERDEEICRQHYFLKVSSSPSRDLDPFINEVHKAVRNIKDIDDICAVHPASTAQTNQQIQKRRISNVGEEDEQNLYMTTVTADEVGDIEEMLKQENCQLITLKKARPSLPK